MRIPQFKFGFMLYDLGYVKFGVTIKMKSLVIYGCNFICAYIAGTRV